MTDGVSRMSVDPAARPPTDWPAPRQVPTSYPGAAPAHHYLLAHGLVVPVAVRPAPGGFAATLGDGTPVDEVLAASGAAPLAERVPVLAYGANRSPHSLALKLVHHGYDRGDRPVAVPVLAGTMAGVDVVAAGLTSQGFVFADLVPSAGTNVSVLVTLLDPEQAAAIHDSEGVGQGLYDCALLPGFEVAGTGVSLEVLAYVLEQPVFVSPRSGTPLAFSLIAAEGRRFPALSQLDVLARVLEECEVLGPVAALLGEEGEPPVAVAHDLARLLNGQWWYAHHTGDRRMLAAERAEEMVREALGRHLAPESTAARLAAEGALIDAAAAYHPGPELRLGRQVALG